MAPTGRQDKQWTVSRDGTIVITLCARVYEREAAIATAYKFTDAWDVNVESAEGKTLAVRLEPKPGSPAAKPERVVAQFCNDVTDQQLRLDLEERNGELRRIIFDHAFAPARAACSKKKAVRHQAPRTPYSL